MGGRLLGLLTQAQSSHWLHPTLFFILKKGHLVALLLKGVWVQFVSMLTLMCTERGSEPTSVLTALQPPLETSLSYVREALATYAPEQVSGVSSSPAPEAGSRPQPVAQYPQWGSAWLINLSRDPYGDPQHQSSMETCEEFGKGAPTPNSSVIWAPNWLCVFPESYKVFRKPAPLALNSA